ncbi:hypothetical protein niasHS_006641 [Heterodera schachtii]|uniref:TATA-box-binding protein n=1 Tax=Heterodera schachtii TaxID=97005 RepID=A0ABD2JI55_HETSC
MDHFGSPANPQSVVSSLLGGQTPMHGVSGIGPSGGPVSVNPSSIQANYQSMFSIGPSSLNVAGAQSIHSTNGPSSIFNPHNEPSSVLNSFSSEFKGPTSVTNLLAGVPSSASYSDQQPPESVSNLAVPMTPLHSAESVHRTPKQHHQPHSAAAQPPPSNMPTFVPATPFSNASVEIPSPTLQNIVSTVNLGVQLDLKQIALRARNAEYNPKRFAAVIMRIREPRTTALIFSSGKMVCTGAKSEETSRLAARKYARIVQKIGFNAKFTEFKVQNMVGSCDVKFPIQLEGLCITHAQFSTYEPELFPGLIYRMVKPRVVLLIFVSGKVVITGAKFKKDIDEAFSQIYPILKGFKKSKAENGQLFEWAVGQFVSFVGANFAGLLPESDENGTSSDVPLSCVSSQFASSALSFGLNVPFFAVRAFFDLVSFDENDQRLIELDFWRFRLVSVWSAILLERQSQLKKLAEETLLSINRHFSHWSVPNDRRAEFALEKVWHHLRYFEHSAAKEALRVASELSGIEKVEFGGALGRRTRFQQKEVPQLFLQVTLSSSQNGDGSLAPSPSELPKNCESGDDTLLERIVFSEGSEQKVLNPVQCACVLGMALVERHDKATADEIRTEETTAFLEEIINQKSCWAVQFRALYERSLLERQNRRRMERACAQLESLGKVLDSATPSSVILSHRLCLLFASNPTPFWTVLKWHANVLLSLGCLSDALRIFERLQLWEETVQCFVSLRQSEKAEALVRRLLEQREEPLYLCLLGDVTGDAECYQKAIRISDDKSFRARFSLAQHLLSRKQFDESMDHYSRAVQIQPLQLTAWFNYGFAAMKCRDFQTASKAFHRCVDIDPSHFEALNNLGASYFLMGERQRAEKIFLEAQKLNRQNSHVLENLQIIEAEAKAKKEAEELAKNQEVIAKKGGDSSNLG